MTTDRPLVIAGATGYGVWPDNSLEGARRCLAEPIDGIEIDVLLTADGHVVAHHDYRLNRRVTRLDGADLAGPGPIVKALTLADLERYEVRGVRVPTLPAVLEALGEADGPRRWLYVEIKTDPQDPEVSPDAEAITRATLAAIEASGWRDRTKIIAFDWRVLRLARAALPDIATAHLTIPAALAHRVRPLANGDSPWADGCDPRHHGGSDLAAIVAHGGTEWSPHYTEVTTTRMAEAAALDLKVGPWGLSANVDIDRMLDLGVYSVTVSGPGWGRETEAANGEL